MNSSKSTKIALMVGALALGGLVAQAAPATADDYDNHGATVAHAIAPWFFDHSAQAEQQRAALATTSQQASVAVPEQLAERRARIAADDEAKRLQQ